MVLLGFGMGLALGLLLNAVAAWFAHRLTRRAIAAPGAGEGFRPAFVEWLYVVRRGDPQARRNAALWIGAAVEAGSGLVVAVLVGLWGVSWVAGLSILVYAYFVLIALIDVKCRLVPNALVLPAMALVLVLAVVWPGLDIRRVLLGGAFGLGIFGLTAWLRPGELGWGDVKLALLIGLLYGFPDALVALAVGVLAGGITAIAMIGTRHGTRSSRIPYAPFLCLGAMVALFVNPTRWLR